MADDKLFTDTPQQMESTLPAQESQFLSPEQIFQQSQQETQAQMGKNTLYGLITSLVTENPSAYFTAKEQNMRLQQNQQLGQQFFKTPEFQGLAPEYQSLVASHAGKGDVENAFQFINAGRQSQQRQQEIKDRRDLEGAANDFSKTGNPAQYMAVLRKQNPQAAATFEQTYGKASRSERRQLMQDISQFATAGLAELEGKDVPAVKQNQQLIQSILAQNPTPADMGLDAKDFAARFGLEANKAIQAKAALKKAQDELGIRATEPGFLRGLGERFGIVSAPAQVSPEVALQASQGVTLTPQQLQQQQQVESERSRLKKTKSSAEAAQAKEVFLTSGVNVPPPAQLPEGSPDAMVEIRLPDGRVGSIPANKLADAVKRGAKPLGQRK